MDISDLSKIFWQFLNYALLGSFNRVFCVVFSGLSLINTARTATTATVTPDAMATECCW